MPATWENDLFRRYLSHIGFSRKQMMRQSWECKRAIEKKHLWGKKKKKTKQDWEKELSNCDTDLTKLGANDTTILLSHWLRTLKIK